MSGIDYSCLLSVTARLIVSALEKDGFYLNRQRGSHRFYKHFDGRRVTVSFHHSGETFLIKTLKSMIEIQAQWNENDLYRLKLLS